MDQDKRLLRKLKRDIKRAGNKRRRQFLKRQLEEKPNDALPTRSLILAVIARSA